MFANNNGKKILIVIHDLVMTVLALIIALSLRFEDQMLEERLRYLVPLAPAFVLTAAGIYRYFQLYQSKWRFASLPDLMNIGKAVALICVLMGFAEIIVLGPELYGQYFLGRRFIVIYFFIQCGLLGGPRLLYRYWKDRYRTDKFDHSVSPALLLGRGSEVDVVIRALESGHFRRIRPMGILSPRRGDLGQSIRNVPVLGMLSALEQVVESFAAAEKPIRRLLVSPSALEIEPEALLVRARKLGLELQRLQGIDDAIAAIAPIRIEDLLLRPAVGIDRARLAGFIAGKRVVVTGGGGSIGSEICSRCVALGAQALLILDHSEPALHEIGESLRAQPTGCAISEHLCDVRDRDRLMTLMRDFSPDLVFHAAALKHVPNLERDWEEGVRTNIFGSLHAAEAALAAGATTFVMISTDKAIRPVSMLGATKRFAEMIMETLDLEQKIHRRSTRLISVRFGNVLGSAGSVIPKFKAQIARGGPVTITHPEMVRYFMTVTEATNLVLVSSAHAHDATVNERSSVYVLRMGQPVRIMDLARKMIELSGFEPGRDIDIQVTGIRPGERLNELLFDESEMALDTGVEGVAAARTQATAPERMANWQLQIHQALAQHDRQAVEAVFREAIADFAPENAGTRIE